MSCGDHIDYFSLCLMSDDRSSPRNDGVLNAAHYRAVFQLIWWLICFFFDICRHNCFKVYVFCMLPILF
jgi:hypothetical protein